MSAPRTVFPLSADEGDLAPGSSPILMDGMEVLFHRTVALYPVKLEPAPPPAPPAGGPVRDRSGLGTSLPS